MGVGLLVHPIVTGIWIASVERLSIVVVKARPWTGATVLMAIRPQTSDRTFCRVGVDIDRRVDTVGQQINVLGERELVDDN